MATAVLGRPRSGWARPRVGLRGGTAAGLVALTGVSLALRAGGIGAHLWMDEGIAVGIAGHPLRDIPGLLRLDGSPPLYSVLLHLWMGVAGASDAAVHWLSIGCALLCVPVARWCGAGLGDRRSGWILAVLVACCPYLTQHAAEARMYPLVVLLGLLCVGCFAQVVVHRRAAYRVPFGLTLALALYAHNWALFLAAALLVAAGLVVRAAPRAQRRALCRDALAGFGLAAVLYAPWLPALLSQAAHTGAPWATAPPLSALLTGPAELLGGAPAAGLLTLAAAAALRARRSAAPLTLCVLSVVPLCLAWGLSQVSPAWDTRYLAVILAPALALAARGLTQAGRVGIAALAVVVALWAPARPQPERSDAYELARAAAPLLHRGDLVIATPFAQVPLLARYLPAGMRYASPLGPAPDPHVVDWRDVTERLAGASVHDELEPLLARARPGSRVLLVVPVAWDGRSGQTALGRLERRRSQQVVTALLGDRRLGLVAALPARLPALPRTSLLRGLVLRKRAVH